MDIVELQKTENELSELLRQVSVMKQRIIDARETEILQSQLQSFTWEQLMMKDVKVGDTIRHKHLKQVFVITGHYGSRLTAVDTADITNEMEWEVFTKNKL